MNHHWIENVWYSRSRLRWLAWPIHGLLLLIAKTKRFLYCSEIIKSSQFNKPVLVVGNITLGGTGKTPFINQLVKLLADTNIKTGIVSRGYRSNLKHYPHQVTEHDSPGEVGDEAFMQYADLNLDETLSVPIVIDPDRPRAINFLIEKNEIDLIISDDGMQHYKMDRNIEVLLFDGQKQFGNQLMLPIGPLREPMSRLSSVDFVVQNGLHCNSFSKYNLQLKVIGFVHLKTGNMVSTENFRNKCVQAVAGIGSPACFFQLLSSICQIKQKQIFRDHHDFSLSDFMGFGNDIIIMTEKDAVKCRSFGLDNWYYLKVEMCFDKTLSKNLLKLIKSKLVKNKV